ncbi:unnamed protein product [Lymnaea stagnalis]|uniref:ASPIC/UnbV domain-containing protein n=1 Tax=Lymnaea stagnalis TaxID=6523 RepID=A0AAV2I186_LYMST
MLLNLLFLSLFSWTEIEAEGMFTDVSYLLPPDTTQLNYGVAVTNVGEGGGPMAWIVAGYSGPNLVLKLNEATNTYENIAKEGTPYEALRDPLGAAIGVCACDIDGDGMEEIYILNTNDRYSGPKLVKDKLFKWRNGRYEDLFDDPANKDVSSMFAGRSVACVDRKGSGKYGFLLATYAEGGSGKFGLIEMDETDPNNILSEGKIVLRNVAESAGIDFSTGGRGIAVGPILGNQGFSDIYFVNEGNSWLRNRGDNALFKNDGRGHYTNVAREVNLDDQDPGRGVTLADFNNDGKTDIVYGNWVRPHKLQIQGVDAGGNTKFTNVATPEFATPSPIRTVIAADFDNSGVLKVFMNNIVYSGMDASNKLYRIEPNGPTVNIVPEDIGDAAEPNQYGTGAAVADINGDGVLEMLVAHGESRAQPLSLYHVSPNKTAGNNWLRVFPLTQFKAPARGAKVSVTLNDGRVLTRIIDGGSGYLCEMEPVAHFGLEKSLAVKLKITWPDNHFATRDLSAADQKKMFMVSYTGELSESKSGVKASAQVAKRPRGDSTRVRKQGSADIPRKPMGSHSRQPRRRNRPPKPEKDSRRDKVKSKKRISKSQADAKKKSRGMGKIATNGEQLQLA